MSCIFNCVFTFIYILQPLCWKALLTSQWPHDFSCSGLKRGKMSKNDTIFNLCIICRSVDHTWSFYLQFYPVPLQPWLSMPHKAIFFCTDEPESTPLRGKEFELYSLLPKWLTLSKAVAFLKRAWLKGERKVTNSSVALQQFIISFTSHSYAGCSADWWSVERLNLVCFRATGQLVQLTERGMGGGGVEGCTHRKHTHKFI